MAACRVASNRVFFFVLGDKSRSKSAHVVLSYMVDHTTILIMGGYSISAAFSR